MADLTPKSLSRKSSSDFIFIFLAFGIWIYCFRHFLSGQMLLVADAVPYFEHVKFFIDQISRGVYPLWDPRAILACPMIYSCGASENLIRFIFWLLSFISLPDFHFIIPTWFSLGHISSSARWDFIFFPKNFLKAMRWVWSPTFCFYFLPLAPHCLHRLWFWSLCRWFGFSSFFYAGSIP